VPPKPFSLSVLAALATGEAHVYAIEQQMIADVRGAILISSRSVYREMPRLIAAGLVAATADTRPQKYRLTPHGRRTLHTERERALQTYRLLQKRL